MRSQFPLKQVVTRPSERLAKIGIVIADSNAIAAQMYRDMLRHLGFREIKIAANGFESVQYLKKMPLAIVLADIGLQLCSRKQSPFIRRLTQDTALPMGGVRLAQRLRHSPASPNQMQPIIIMLDHEHPEQIRPVRDAGANQIVFKPLRAYELCKAIIDIVDRPRVFVMAKNYKGPCRRQESAGFYKGKNDRRKRSVCLIRHNDHDAEQKV